MERTHHGDSTRCVHQHGVSLVESILGITIMLIVFLALYASFDVATRLGALNRLRTTALLVANERIEKIRALPYDAVGTIAGLPPGEIPQVEVVTRNGHDFTVRTFIQYVDDPADGSGVGDTLAADYKRIKIEVLYTYRSATQAFSYVTTVAPRSQEALTGAGILQITVTDAANIPLGGVTTHVVNTTVATSVDITTYTNAQGIVSFPGAWAGTGYQVVVGKSGYSGAQTYNASSTNPNPSPSPATVAEGFTTGLMFKIDRLSTLNIQTRTWPQHGRVVNTFADTSQLQARADTEVAGGTLALTGTPGSYAMHGYATSTSMTLPAGGVWNVLYASGTAPIGTTMRFHVYYDSGGGVFLPVPEDVLPGNAVGIIFTPFSLRDLEDDVHGTIRIVADLATADPAVTPTLDELYVSYEHAATPIGNVAMTLRGSKTIGTDAGGNPVYKYDVSFLSSALGVWQTNTIEWDAYELGVSGYTIASACPSLPVVLQPDTTRDQTMTLTGATSHALIVNVLDGDGNTLPHADVHIKGGTTDLTRATDSCGSAYLPLSSSGTYAVSVTVANFPRYATTTAVSGVTNLAVTLVP